MLLEKFPRALALLTIFRTKTSRDAVGLLVLANRGLANQARAWVIRGGATSGGFDCMVIAPALGQMLHYSIRQTKSRLEVLGVECGGKLLPLIGMWDEKNKLNPTCVFEKERK